MPLTTLDPVTAIVIIDLQKGIISYPLVHPVADIIARNVELLAAFRAKNLPVVLVNVDARAPGRTEQGARTGATTFPPDFAELIPELNRQPTDIVVTKKSWGAFATTDLESQLKARNVTQVVVTGVATASGVESTARQAYEQGFHVTLALDAMTDMREESHNYVVANVFPRVGETGTTQGIIALLNQQ